MPRRSDAVELELPDDLAQLVERAGLGEPAAVRKRSVLVAILTGGLTVTTTVITLGQGPLTATQLLDLFRLWRAERRAAGADIGRVTFRGPRGRIDVTFDRETDVHALAELAHRTLFAASGPAHREGDDL
jgi:hypothetical protein